MKRNIGNLDRIIRVLVAIFIAVLYRTEVISGLTAIILLTIGGIFLLTSAIGTCPLYLPFGINTIKKKK